MRLNISQNNTHIKLLLSMLIVVQMRLEIQNRIDAAILVSVGNVVLR